MVSEGAQTFLSGAVGPYLGIAAAGLLVFLLAPLQRLGDRVARGTVPHAGELAEARGGAAAALYRDQAAFAWAKGHLKVKERRLLDKLREHLRLGHEEAARLEHEAASLPMGEPSAATPARPARPGARGRRRA